MSFWVYILECVDGSYYVGQTENLEKRIAEHQQNAFRSYTSRRLPVKLMYCTEFPGRGEALAREQQIKKWSHCKKQALVEEDWTKLVKYSRGKGLTLRQAQGERK